MSKKLVYLLSVVGGTIGSYIPVLFGSSGFSAASMIGFVIGSFAGIYAGIKLSDYF